MEGSDKDPPPDERTELLQALAGSVGEFLQHSVPTLSEDAVIALAVGVATEQIDQIDNEIMLSLSGELLEKYPTLLVALRQLPLVEGEPVVTITGNKSLAAATTPKDALTTAMLLSFLNSPYHRAVLRALGYVYSFGQSADTPLGQKPKILM
jgi:hypothetical protein